MEVEMNLLEQIEQQVKQLPYDKQHEVLDFASFLRQRAMQTAAVPRRALHQHPAFGVWRGREIDALAYQDKLRAEWN